MRLRLRSVSLVACMAALSLAASVSLACDGSAQACAAKGATHASCAALTQAAPAQPAPALAALPGIPALLPSLAPEPIVAGLRAFIDPETGLLTSTTELQAPGDVFAPVVNLADLPQVELPNGSWMVDTSGLMMDNFVLHLDAFGHRQFECTQDTHAARVPATLPTPTTYQER